MGGGDPGCGSGSPGGGSGGPGGDSGVPGGGVLNKVLLNGFCVVKKDTV